MARCLPRKDCPSSTSERNSSCVSGACPSPPGRIASNLSSPRTKRLTNQTTGVAILSIGARMKLTNGARRSACAAPMTLGVISEKTSNANEIATVPSASAASPSPNRRLVMTAVSVAAAAATSVLPSRMTPSSVSVWAEQRERELCAPGPLLGSMPKSITIDRHHRGFGDREESRCDEQRHKGQKQAAQGSVVQAG